MPSLHSENVTTKGQQTLSPCQEGMSTSYTSAESILISDYNRCHGHRSAPCP